MFKGCEHHANYYEIDQVGCAHHSSFIRQMEEARIDMMERMGCGYRSMEEAGIISPVLEISCRYRTMAHFDDRILIRVKMKAYDATRMILSYEMRGKVTGELQAAGKSSHCFLNREGHSVSLKRTYPTRDETFQKAMATQNI